MSRHLASRVVRSTLLLLAVTLLFPTFAAEAAPRAKDTTSTSGGGKTSTFAWSTYDVSIANPVEQWVEWPFPSSDKWVFNPYTAYSTSGPCAWDVDDHWYVLGSGPLNAGASVSLEQCRVADPSSIYQTRYGTEAWWTTPPRSTGIRIESPSGDLRVSVSYAPQSTTFSIPASYDAARNVYVYRACIAVEYNPSDPAWPYQRDEAVQPVPGSNGGSGVLTRGTIEVANPTGRKVNVTGKVEELASWVSDSTMADFCSARRGRPATWQTQYPFQFSLG
jgi:hypothetical protein